MLTKKIATVAIFGLVLTGCGGSNNPLNQNNPGVRLFNGLDGQPSVTAAFKDTNLHLLATFSSAAYGLTSNDTSVSNSNVTSTLTANGAALFTTPATLLRINSFYTLYTGGNAVGNYASQMLQDSQAVLPANTAAFRVVHMGVNTGAVDIYFSSGTTLNPTSAIFTNLVYGAVTTSANSAQAVDASGYSAIPITPSATYTVFVTAHGSMPVVAQVQINPLDKSSYTIAVFDRAGVAGTSVVVLPDVRTG